MDFAQLSKFLKVFQPQTEMGSDPASSDDPGAPGAGGNLGMSGWQGIRNYAARADNAMQGQGISQAPREMQPPSPPSGPPMPPAPMQIQPASIHRADPTAIAALIQQMQQQRQMQPRPTQGLLPKGY